MTERYNIDISRLPRHYIQRGPSATLGIVSILACLVLLGYAVSEVRRAGQSQPALSIIAGAETGENVPVLALTPSGSRLNGTEITDTDLIFRLSGLATSAHGIVIEYDPQSSAARLSKGLGQINQAGFIQVGLRTQSGDMNTTSIF